MLPLSLAFDAIPMTRMRSRATRAGVAIPTTWTRGHPRVAMPHMTATLASSDSILNGVVAPAQAVVALPAAVVALQRSLAAGEPLLLAAGEPLLPPESQCGGSPLSQLRARAVQRSISGSCSRGVLPASLFHRLSNYYSLFWGTRRFQHKARHPPKSCTSWKIRDRLLLHRTYL